ncbi:MAG: acyltransferase [Bacteroidetes bacterium]|nr:acyltransferase [Bacteroidota bacterium]
MKEGGFYIKGLDTLRAIAALAVVIYHIELFKKKYNTSNYFDYPFFANTGGCIAVILFFVLSGYLITLLLLKEKTIYKKISLKKFYIRRMLRIWPLYYIILIVSIILLDYTPTTFALVLCFTIFPNISHALGYGWEASPQIWSIGVEEQFYLVWPFIIKYLKKKYLIVFLVTFFIAFTILPHIILFALNRVYPNQQLMDFTFKFFYGTKFNCIAVGAFFAVIYHNKSKVLNILDNNLILIGSFMTATTLWCIGFQIKYFTSEFYAVLFGLLILTTSINSKFNFEPSVFKFLGKISYGLYMYHWIIIELIMRNFSLYFTKTSVISNIVLYVSILTMTIITASLSYFYIEKRILKIKNKFRAI